MELVEELEVQLLLHQCLHQEHLQVQLQCQNAAVTLTTAQMPSHTHSETGSTGVNQSGGATKAPVLGVPSGTTTGSTGGGGSHTHANTASFSGTALDFNVQFIDIILCSKD